MVTTSRSIQSRLGKAPLRRQPIKGGKGLLQRMGRSSWPLQWRVIAVLASLILLWECQIVYKFMRLYEALALPDIGTQNPLLQAVASHGDSATNNACLRQGYGTLAFFHMRKAAGTSVMHLLQSLVKQDFASVMWSKFYRSEGRTFNVDCLNSDIVFMTSLRDPVPRILSSYHFEGRRFRYNIHGYFENEERRAEAMAAHEKARGGGVGPVPVTTLRHWMADVQQDYQNQSAAYQHDALWVDVENYYIKTLTNRYRAHPEYPVTRQDLKLAKQILGSMDLVLITEWLDTPDQLAYFNSLLGVNDVTFARLNKGHQPVRSFLTIPRDIKETAEEIKEKPELVAQLQAMNKLDIELYEWAKVLVRGRIDAELALMAKEGPASERDKHFDVRQCVREKYHSPPRTAEYNGTIQDINEAPECFGVAVWHPLPGDQTQRARQSQVVSPPPWGQATAPHASDERSSEAMLT